MAAATQGVSHNRIEGDRYKYLWTAALLLVLVLPVRVFCSEVPSGKVVWWGRDDFGKGYSEHANGVIEWDDEIVSNVVAIAGNTGQAVLLKSDGTVVSVGDYIFGGNRVPAGLTNVISITAQANSYWAIRRDGTVARWGNEDSEPDKANIVAGLSNTVSVIWTGHRGYLALNQDGTVLGFRLDEASPGIKQVKVRGQVLNNVVAVAPLCFTPLVLKRDGTVCQLGYQTLGVPPVEPRIEAHDNELYMILGGESAQVPYQYTSADPVLIGGKAVSNVVALSSGLENGLALKKDGTAVGWGRSAKDSAPILAGLSNCIAVAGSENQGMVLRKDGTVFAWGDNSFGLTSVPAGLSNVIAIAASGDFNLALTTGDIPSSAFIAPHGRLEEMERESDLVFKGRVVSSSPITNAGFPNWGHPHTTKLQIVSMLKGEVSGKTVDLLHITQGPEAWSGGTPPPDFIQDAGQSYLIFAARADKPDWLYSPSSNYITGPGIFRQLMRGYPPIHTLDDRPLPGIGVKEAHWRELNLLLKDTAATNQFYSLDKLDHMSLAGRRDDSWSRSKDFRRRDVLSAILPLVTNANDRVAIRAIDCFEMESNALTKLEPFAATLAGVANAGPSADLQIEAIRALSGTHFEVVSNSFVQLLQNTNGNVRARAIALLKPFPGNFSEEVLRKYAADPSPKVRAAVADVIGECQASNLLTMLVKLFADPVGRQKPIAPLTLQELEAGGRIVGIDGGITIVDDPSYPGANVGDVHTSAGYALLKFDVVQVSEILKTNLTDPGFRLQFLLHLASAEPGPWLNDMAEVMEARAARNLREARRTGRSLQVANYLSGAHHNCWSIIYHYLEGLPTAAFANGALDRYLKVLEEAGNTGSQEPVTLYTLFVTKGLKRRASQFRDENGKYTGQDLTEFFNRVDAENATNQANSRK